MKGIAKLILSSKYLQERTIDPKEYPALVRELRRFADDIEDGVYENVNYVSHSDDMNDVFYEPVVMPRNHSSMMVNGINRQFAVSANYKVRPTKRATDVCPFCQGRGYIHNVYRKVVECPTCDGTGQSR